MNDIHTVEPVGILHTPFTDGSGTPAQGAFDPGATGTLEVYEQYADGLLHIDQFSHLVILYLTHQAGPASLRPIPCLDNQPHGVFASRCPTRPNHIAMMVVRLDRVDGRVLHLANVDAFDGTPVIDIKPYVARFDSVPGATEGWYAPAIAARDVAPPAV